MDLEEPSSSDDTVQAAHTHTHTERRLQGAACTVSLCVRASVSRGGSKNNCTDVRLDKSCGAGQCRKHKGSGMSSSHEELCLHAFDKQTNLL